MTECAYMGLILITSVVALATMLFTFNYLSNQLRIKEFLDFSVRVIAPITLSLFITLLVFFTVPKKIVITKCSGPAKTMACLK